MAVLDDERRRSGRRSARLRPARSSRTLEEAARSRSEADWIVGMNATRAATIRLRSSLRRRRLARPRADADARDRRPPRGGDPRVHARALLARRRDVRAADGEPARYDGPLPRRRAAAAARRPRRPTAIVAAVARPARRDHQAREDRAARAARRCSTTSRRCSATPTRASASPPGARSPPPSGSTRSTRRSPIRARTRASCRATWSREIKPIAELVGAQPRVRARRAAYVTGLDVLPLGRVVNDAKVTDHHAIIPTQLRAPASTR